jgi:hypothetical protein
MASQSNSNRSNHKHISYSPVKFLFTLVNESFRNLGDTTRVVVSKNGNGGKVIRTEVSKRKNKSK